MKKLITVFVLVTMCLVTVSCNAENEGSSSSQVQRGGMVQLEELLPPTTLLEENGCLRIEDYGKSYLLILPHGFSVGVDEEGTMVIDEEGKTVARVGDTIQVGGGEVSAGVAREATGGSLPEGCPGPYYLVGSIVGAGSPQPESTSDKYAELAEKYKDDPALFDAAVYAEEAGITMDEALRRLELQPVIGKLDGELSSKETKTFAGLWIEIPPAEFKVVILFTENGEETIEPYLQSYPELADIIEVRSAQYSLIELGNAQQEMHNALEGLGIFTESGGDVKGNCVNVYVIDRALIDNAVRDGKLEMPDCVKIITVEGLAEDE